VWLDGQLHATASLPLGKTRTHYVGGWVGPRTGLDGCGKSRPHRDSITGPSSPSRDAIQNALFRPILISLLRILYIYIYIRPSRHVHIRGNRNVSLLKRSPLNRGTSNKTGSCHYSWKNPIQTFGFLFLGDKTHCIYLQLAMSPMFLRHQQPSLFLTNNIGLMANSNQSSHRALAHMAV